MVILLIWGRFGGDLSENHPGIFHISAINIFSLPNLSHLLGDLIFAGYKLEGPDTKICEDPDWTPADPVSCKKME